MLILAGVTISIIINGRLFEQAQTAALETRGGAVHDEAQVWKAEVATAYYANGDSRTAEEIIQDLFNRNLLTEQERDSLLTDGIYNNGSVLIGSQEIDFNISFDNNLNERYITELVRNGTIKIGDYVAYAPDPISSSDLPIVQDFITYGGENARFNLDSCQETLNWRLIGFSDDGNIMLVSEKPTTKSPWVKNTFDGYNNWVYLSNEFCRTLYSKEGVGIARNISIEDIEKYVKPEVLTRRDYSTIPDTLAAFTGTHAVPKLWIREPDSNFDGLAIQQPLSRSEMTREDLCLGTITSTIEVSTSSLAYNSKDFDSSDWIDPIYYSLFYGHTPYGYKISSRATWYTKDTYYHNLRFRSLLHTWK
jgi:hypothetical protein